MSTTTTPPATAVPEGAELDLNSAELGHPGSPPVLAALDLRVAPGKVLTVVGPSGCGKSTCCALSPGCCPSWPERPPRHPEARSALATATSDPDADVRAYAARATS
ncbi:hypothetical protein [Streptomyces sp. NBC_00212]|uniref:hypothetical protein n=1 Tax=Streptomyces sp. NBC_00212 TaxID=2975684 RepID=UPI003866A920